MPSDVVLVRQGGNVIPLEDVITEMNEVNGAPVEVSGARDETEGALADLLTALESLGLITDSTTAS